MNEELYFKKVYGISEYDVVTMEWKSLHSLRSEIKRKSDELIRLAEKDKRPLREDEDKAFQFALKLIDEVNEEFSRRNEAGTKDPIQPRRIDFGVVIGNDGSGKKSGDARLMKAKEFAIENREDMAGFKDAADFILAVHDREKRAQLEGVATQGGFAVPGALADTIWTTTMQTGIAVPRCTMFPMDTATLNIAGFQNEDRDSSWFGVTPAYAGEGDELSASTLALRMVSLEARKLYLMCEASREVLQDSRSLGGQIVQKMGQALAAQMDYDIVRGSGVGRPSGIINSPALIKVGRQTAGQISLTDIQNMASRLAPEFTQAVWIASPDARPQLYALKDSANALVWAAGGDVASGSPATLYGFPVIFSEAMAATLGSLGDIILVDFSAVCLGMRQPLIAESSPYPKWSTDLVSFRTIVRWDAKSLLSKPITPKNGGASLSAYIALE